MPATNDDQPPGRARELTRRPSPRPVTHDTGRRHHIGSAPPVLAVLRPDGTTGITRTAPVQLIDQPAAALDRLAAELAQEMAAAADVLDFEGAAHLRDEIRAVQDEVARRGEAP